MEGLEFKIYTVLAELLADQRKLVVKEIKNEDTGVNKKQK